MHNGGAYSAGYQLGQIKQNTKETWAEAYAKLPQAVA
jgi:hypothetical protein